MSVTGGEPRVLSRPYEVVWAGWRTDTLALQNAGWRLAVEYAAERHKYRLLMDHPAMQLMAITYVSQLDYQDTKYISSKPLLRFEVAHIARTLHVVQMQEPTNWADFKQLDAQPCFTQSRIERLEDFNIFNVCLKRTEEILVNQADMSVVAHLEAIRQLQEPKQKELRAKVLREREVAPRSQVIAQIVEFRREAA